LCTKRTQVQSVTFGMNQADCMYVTQRYDKCSAVVRIRWSNAMYCLVFLANVNLRLSVCL